MVINPEQASEIKKQLLVQVEKMPEAQQEQVSKYIESLNEEELEQFLKQNKIDFTEKSPSETECIFCSIIKGEIPSYKLGENKNAIAILEINPLSKGHSIILPKQHTTIEKIPKSSFALAHKLAKRMKKKLKPEDIKIETSSFRGHAMINIIPIYKDKEFKKSKAEESDLTQLQKKLETKTREKRKPEIKEIKALYEFKMRIP